MDDHQHFIGERRKRVQSVKSNAALTKAAEDFLKQSLYGEYSYNFDWMGLPIIQYPQDMFALQEIIWKVKPDLIIETGIARGGSLIFYASMLELLGGNGKVLGIDIDIHKHNRQRILNHPLSRRLKMIEGSSVDTDVHKKVCEIASQYQTILICLDSNHTHNHVLKELRFYAPLVTQGSYCIVFDTIVEIMPNNHYQNRPWNKGNSPATAVSRYLKECNNFEVDVNIDRKLLISAALGGYLRRI